MKAGRQGATVSSDTRITYGACCTWWNSIQKTSSQSSGLPCCPHCGGVLFETENEDEFWRGALEYEKTEPGYTVMLRWMRGRCFRNFNEAKQAYRLVKLASEEDNDDC